MKIFRRYAGFHPNIRKFILGMFLVGLGSTFWGLFFNLYLDALGLSKAEIGSVLALSNVATALFAIPAGFLCASGNLKRLLIVGHAFAVLMYSCAIFAGTSVWLSVFVFLASGFATVSRVVSGPLIMGNSTSRDRSYIFSAFFLTSYVGSIVGFASAGAIRHELSSLVSSVDAAYRFALLGGLFLSLTGVVPFFLMRSDFRQTLSARSVGLSFLDFRNLNWRFFRRALAPMILIGTGAGIIVQFMNLYFKDVFSLSDDVIGYLMAAQAITTSLGALVSPMLAERFGRVTTVVGTQLLSVPFMVAMGLTNNVLVAQVCFVVRAALMNMAGPVSTALLMEFASTEEQGFLNALLACAQSATWALAAWIYGHVLRGDYAQSFLIAAMLYSVASVMYYVFFRGLEKTHDNKKPSGNEVANKQFGEN